MKFQFGEIEIKPSSVDRVVFPDAGLTKGDVIQYYVDVAELILPELIDRPLSVQRFNKGINGEGFYQKHAQKFYPAWLERAEVEAKKTIVAPVVQKVADLVYMANQNALTFHVPTATISKPSHPDRLIFDLDPPPDRFDLVLDAARAVGDLLAELDLPSLLKTTGSKGLHVVVPLDSSDGYKAVYAFAATCATLLCRRHSELFTREFYKKDRGGRLFLDIGRNSWQATAVAAYSVRARPGAPVSLPIAWDELDDLKRPDGIGIRELPNRLDAVGNLWAEFGARRCNLANATAQVAALEGGGN